MYKILVINFNPQSVNNTHLGFISAGCEVLNYACQSYNYSDDFLEAELNRLTESFKPDMVFSYGWWRGRVNVETFGSIIKQKGLFHVFWAFDDPDCFDTISLPIAREADLVFTSVVECIPKYREAGVDACLLLHGCHPPHHRRVPPSDEFRHDMVLLANNYNVKWNPDYFSYRYNGIRDLLQPLVERDYDIKVWGLWWDSPDRIYNLPPKYYGSTLPYGNEAKVYSSCKIGLGLQTVGNSSSHFSVRTLEVLACGTFHLCQYSPALENFFRKGVHMEWSRSPDETVDIVDFYLKHPMLRESIAQQGQEEVYAKHTLTHRAREALEIIKKYVK